VQSVDLVAWGGLAVGGRGVVVCIWGDWIV